MRIKHAATAGVIVVAALTAGCASKQTRKVTPSGFLGQDTQLLQKGEKGRAMMRYSAPGVDWKQYQAILVEPVQYWTDPGRKEKLPEADRKKLTDYMYGQLQNAMGKKWRLATQPGPGTIRLQFALVEAKGSNVTLDTISSIVPQAFALSSLKNGVTGKPAGVGEVQTEAKATDSQSGQVLAEAVDKRVGKKKFGGKFNKWDDVESAIRYWSTLTAYRLCTEQGRPDCEKPTEEKPKEKEAAASK